MTTRDKLIERVRVAVRSEGIILTDKQAASIVDALGLVEMYEVCEAIDASREALDDWLNRRALSKLRGEQS